MATAIHLDFLGLHKIIRKREESPPLSAWPPSLIDLDTRGGCPCRTSCLPQTIPRGRNCIITFPAHPFRRPLLQFLQNYPSNTVSIHKSNPPNPSPSLRFALRPRGARSQTSLDCQHKPARRAMPSLSQYLSTWMEQALGFWYRPAAGLVVVVTITLDIFLCLGMVILALRLRQLIRH